MGRTVLVLEPRDYSEEALRLYEHVGEIELCQQGPPENTRSDVRVLVVRLAYHLNSEFLERFPGLRYLVSPTTALNHVDTECCRNRGIEVISLKGHEDFLRSVTATGELTFGLLLAVVRKIPAGHDSATRDRVWDRNICKGRDLSEMILGILGLGRVGRQMAGYGRAFGMKVLACDPHADGEDFARCGTERVSKQDLFARSDVVSLHVNYCKENEGIVGRPEFSQMKEGSYFINTSRGELVDEKALLDALESSRLAGAGLDVLNNEQDLQLAGRPLVEYARTHDNLVVTPHIGGCTIDSMHKTEIFVARKLLAAAGKRARS